MPYRLALVEYLNTFPFSEGLRLNGSSHHLDVQPVTPAECARLFNEGKVDISLCPVGALNDLPAHEICGKYCIGADGEVGTVVLLSQVPIESISRVRLDDHSRTSNLLLQVLARNHWKKDWAYYFNPVEKLPESCLMIGDKVFEYKEKYAYSYDLAEAWKEMTGLPMVFAVWIARPGVPGEAIELLDAAFEKGMALVKNGQSGLQQWQTDYLMNFISYPLDSQKMKALRLYQSLCTES